MHDITLKDYTALGKTATTTTTTKIIIWVGGLSKSPI